MRINFVKSHLLRIKDRVVTFLNKDKKKIIKFFYYALVFITCILTNGYAKTTDASFSAGTYFLLISVFIMGGIFILLYPLKHISFSSLIKDNADLVVYLVSILMILVSFVFTREFAYYLSYIRILLLITFAFFVSQLIRFNDFIAFFSNSMLIISIVSLLFFTLTNLFGNKWFLNQFENVNGVLFNNYFNIYFTYNYSWKRNMAIFWEPGVYGSFLILAILSELIFKKTNYLKISVFIFSLVLTFSTAAYIIACLLVFIFISEKFNNRKGNILLYSLIILSLISLVFYKEVFTFLSKFFPFFNKLITQNISLTTRLNSPLVNFTIFQNNILYGAGIHGAEVKYLEYISLLPELIDSQTSTTGMYIAKFGVLGVLFSFLTLLSPILVKNRRLITRFFVIMMFFLIINKEPHMGMTLVLIFSFYFIRDIEKKPLNELETEKNIFTILTSSENVKQLSRNVSGSLVIKGLAVFVSVMTTPAYIRYVDNEIAIGVWFTLLSILSWILMFDVGIGNGIKNFLLNSIVKKKYDEAKKYVAATYFSVFFISVILAIVGTILILNINMNNFFNVAETTISNNTLRLVVLISFFAIILEFAMKPIISILHVYQKQGLASSLALITSVLMLLFTKFVDFENLSDKLIFLSVAYLVFLNVPLLISTIVLFSKYLKEIRPRFSDYDKLILKKIVNFGIVFFIIQIALLIFNASNEMLITQLWGPEFVKDYSLYNKVFSVFITLSSLLSGPIWISASKGYSEKNIAWIKKLNKLIKTALIVYIVITVFITLGLQLVFNVWLGDVSINVNYIYAMVFCVYYIFLFSQMLISAVSNGIVALKTQLFGLTAISVLKILLIIVFKTYFFKNADWIVVLILSTILMMPIPFVQYFENKRKIATIKPIEEGVN